jgi:hypothetical protein
MANEKIYVGKARYIDTRYGEMCKIWLTPEGVEAINANVDNNGGINLNMNEMKEPDRAGNTHYLTVDDWRPSRNEGGHRHGPQRGSTNGDSRRYAGRDTGRPENRGYSRRDDGGFGAYGNSEHRYGPEDRDPPAANRANNGPNGAYRANGQNAGSDGAARDEMPNAGNVSPESFPEQEIERGVQAPADDYSDIDDEIPF